MRVLLVDDSSTVRARLAAMLSEIDGVVVYEAGSAEEALALVRQTPFAAVVLDLHLPGQSGLTLLSELSARAPAAELIVLSNEASDHHRREALARGAARFLDKSREFRELGGLIRELPLTRKS